MNAKAVFQTEHAERHLAALCRHFGQKVPTSIDGQSGHVLFAFGQCTLLADADRLTLVVSATETAQVDQLIDVVTRHLERFAFRENPSLEWAPAPAPHQG